MENKIERLKAFIKTTKTPIYIEKNVEILDSLSIKIKANCTEQELYEIEKKLKSNPTPMIQIELDNSTKEQQKRFVSLLKDKTIGTHKLQEETKIIVYSKNKNIVDNELMGLMVVI